MNDSKHHEGEHHEGPIDENGDPVIPEESEHDHQGPMDENGDPIMPADGTQTRHTVNESADKIQAETKVKRGTDTRDQDTIKVKVKGDDPDGVVADMNRMIALMKNSAKGAREVGNE